MRQALKLNVHGETQVVDLEAPEGSLKVLQSAVDGYVQPVDLSDDMTMWVNEEGKIIGLIRNDKANTIFRNTFGAVDVIMGDVIFTGGVDDEGDTMGLTDAQVNSLLQAVK
jgi:hypothetical protein